MPNILSIRVQCFSVVVTSSDLFVLRCRPSVPVAEMRACMWLHNTSDDDRRLGQIDLWEKLSRWLHNTSDDDRRLGQTDLFGKLSQWDTRAFLKSLAFWTGGPSGKDEALGVDRPFGKDEPLGVDRPFGKDEPLREVCLLGRCVTGKYGCVDVWNTVGISRR